MNRRKIILLAFALLLGLGTFGMMRQAMHRPTVASGTEVLVAASDIPSGTFLQTQNLRWQAWEPGHVTEAFVRRDAKTNPQELVGAVARQGIRKGEPIL
nr:SAF domain-containing protein [Alphaproteobacteria bacterium]